jgi:DNA gyrase subunit A
MKLKNGEDGVVSCDVAREGAEMLFVSSSGHGKRTPLDEFHRQGRGGMGVRGMKLPPARGEVVAAFTVSDDDEILVFSSEGNIVRMSVTEISQQGRAATGVRVARIGEGESVVAVARVLETVGDEDGPTLDTEAATGSDDNAPALASDDVTETSDDTGNDDTGSGYTDDAGGTRGEEDDEQAGDGQEGETS